MNSASCSQVKGVILINKLNYSILVSAVLVLILYLQDSPVLWPGTFFFLVQVFLMGVIYLLIRVMKKRNKVHLLPVIRQYQIFFGVMFPLWILIALSGRLASPVGRGFALIFFLLFFSLAIVLLVRLIDSGDLLDRFK